MSELVEAILTMSRLETGSEEFSFAPLDLNRLMRHVERKIRHRVDEKRLTVTLDLDHAILPIHGNAAQLQQVLLNVIKNAVDYTPDGGTITVRTYARFSRTFRALSYDVS